MTPDLVVHFGPRAVLSLIGIATIIVGVWQVDRTWDEEGLKAFERAKELHPEDPVIPDDELAAAGRFPLLFLIGWVLLAIAYLFPANGSGSIEVSAAGIISLLLALLLASVASIPMSDAVRHRKAKKKQMLSMMFAGGWIALAVFSAIAASGGASSYVFSGLGVLSILISMQLLWKFRKMGNSWEQDARPNPNPIVYNPGGSLFVAGWFLFWVAMSATNEGVLDGGLPLYFNVRTALAFLVGFTMVPVVMLVDYAHDEGAPYVGFGTDGSHFGRFFESPIPFVLMCVVFGFASFFALDNSFDPDLRSWLLLATAIAQGIWAGVLLQTATYKQNHALKARLSPGFVTLFFLLAINIGFDGAPAIYLAIAGAMFTLMSQRLSFTHRKRGDHWMKTGEPNPNPIVYSPGIPMFQVGWTLLALAVSVGVR